MGSFSNSWALARQSWRVLVEDKRLVVFPIMSAAACLLVMASFAVPVILSTNLGAWTNQNHVQATLHQPAAYLVAFAFYFVNFAVIAFFNAALIGCAMLKFDGQPAGVGDGLRIAASRLPQILGWALVAATVGMVLRAISERAGFIGRIVISLVGMAWSIATYFVVPVLVAEGVGPIEAVKRSTAVIRKTWGESLVANLGLGAVSLLGFLASLTPLGVGIALTAAAQSPWPAVGGAAVMVVMLIGVALISSTLQMILLAALYRFAATGTVPGGFDGQLLSRAFRTKGTKN
jgi:hypothetical protein